MEMSTQSLVFEAREIDVVRGVVRWSFKEGRLIASLLISSPGYISLIFFINIITEEDGVRNTCTPLATLSPLSCLVDVPVVCNIH